MGMVLGMLLWLGLLGTVFVTVPWTLTVRLTPEEKRERVKRWLTSWSLKGLLMPMALWAIMNVGLTWALQPFMPEVQAARLRGGNWFPEYVDVVGNGAFVVSSYWSAVTLGWVLISALRNVDDAQRKEFRGLAITCSLVLGIPAVIIGVTGGLLVAGLAATLLLAPMAKYGREILQPRRLPPMYARAIARIKFGKYAEAEWEIIKELENWEDDFEGWMMLADLYANKFNDLSEAERTILQVCDQPKVTPSQLSIALHRLSEWQLRFLPDPAAARRTLQLICERLKGTHLAYMAQLRLNQLPASAFELRERQTAQTIPLPALGDQLDLPVPAAPMDKGKATSLANACVEQLKQNPDNVMAREKLARTFAEHLNKAPLGIEQIQLLLDMPNRSETEKAGWLGLIAAWQIKYCNDLDAATGFLERLVREFPNSVQALAARRRLELIGRQLKHKPT